MRGRYIVECGGVRVSRSTLKEAKHLADLQERRHGGRARIYLFSDSLCEIKRDPPEKET